MTNEVDTNTAVQKNIFSTKDMTLIAMFAVLMAVCSWISIPTQVPFTLQTFAVFCTLGVLGGKRGFFAVLVYVLLGAVGVPVFAGFTGGIGENQINVRKKICKYLEFMGLIIDEDKNNVKGEEVLITKPESKIKAYIIPTNEELVIARDTLKLIK